MKKKTVKSSEYMTRDEFYREINIVLRGILDSLQPLTKASREILKERKSQ